MLSLGKTRSGGSEMFQRWSFELRVGSLLCSFSVFCLLRSPEAVSIVGFIARLLSSSQRSVSVKTKMWPLLWVSVISSGCVCHRRRTTRVTVSPSTQTIDRRFPHEWYNPQQQAAAATLEFHTIYPPTPKPETIKRTFSTNMQLVPFFLLTLSWCLLGSSAGRRPWHLRKRRGERHLF